MADVLRATGRGQDAGFSRYHNVLSRSRWSALAAARLLLGRLVATFVPAGLVVIGLDDTIERRWGAKIAGRGIYRDPVRSSMAISSRPAACAGCRPCCWTDATGTASVGLPFLTVLMPSQRWAERRGVRHKSLVDGARQMLPSTGSGQGRRSPGGYPTGASWLSPTAVSPQSICSAPYAAMSAW